ncbi:hypothetical protein [Clostridium butyricum]|uniref:hypothetical protein n=1 Tax=Clostridium butyricum TaxID=1492 RepID=UPI00374F9163
MKINDIRTLSEISIQYNIPIKTLQSRLKNLDENVDYRKLGKRQPTILSPKGIDKILKSSKESNNGKGL